MDLTRTNTAGSPADDHLVKVRLADAYRLRRREAGLIAKLSTQRRTLSTSIPVAESGVGAP